MFRLCVVGSGGVGKSSLTIRYLKNEFTEVMCSQIFFKSVDHCFVQYLLEKGHCLLLLLLRVPTTTGIFLGFKTMWRKQNLASALGMQKKI